MKEIWRDIESYDDYQVSNLGRVRSCKFCKEKILRPQNNGNGYLEVILCKTGIKKHMTIHRLVAKAFLPNPDNLPVINHKDENKQNNLVTNLEWCSYSYNNSYNDKGKKIGAKRSKKVGQYSKEGKLIKIWASQQEAAGNGFMQQAICKCCKGKRKTHAGYIWKYIDN